MNLYEMEDCYQFVSDTSIQVISDDKVHEFVDNILEVEMFPHLGDCNKEDNKAYIIYYYGNKKEN